MFNGQVYSQGESEGSASPPGGKENVFQSFESSIEIPNVTTLAGPGTRESSSAAGREVVEESRLLQEAGGARGDSRMLQARTLARCVLSRRGPGKNVLLVYVTLIVLLNLQQETTHVDHFIGHLL